MEGHAHTFCNGDQILLTGLLDERSISISKSTFDTASKEYNSITEFLLYLKIFSHYWMFWIPKTIAMSKATDWIKDIGPQHLSLALNCPDYKLGLNSDLGMLIAGARFASLNASVRINQVKGAVLLLACCRNFVIVRSSPPDHSTKQLEC